MPSIQKHGPLVILGGAIIWASMVIGYLATHPEPKQKINTDSIFKAGMEQGKKQVLDSIATVVPNIFWHINSLRSPSM